MEQEKLKSTEEKKEEILAQDKKHKIAIYISLFGIVLLLLLKNTTLGFNIGYIILLITFVNWLKLLMRKKIYARPKMLTSSFLLFLAALIILAGFYYPQIIEFTNHH